MDDQIKQEKRDQSRQRQDKLTQMKQDGFGYPNHYKLSHRIVDIKARVNEQGLDEHQYATAGRIMSMRVMGKAAFVQVQDGSGSLQIYLRSNNLGERYQQFLSWDLGDIIWVKGHAFRTKVGELSLWVSDIQILNKSLHPLPDKYHGLSDTELRYRRRYLDIMVNQDSKDRFLARSMVT